MLFIGVTRTFNDKDVSKPLSKYYYLLVYFFGYYGYSAWLLADKKVINVRKNRHLGSPWNQQMIRLSFLLIQASRVSRFRLERNASWDTLGQKVSTTSTRTQESNKQNREFTEENYGWVSRNLEKYQKLQGSSA